MIAGCYSLHLYCDVPACPHGRWSSEEARAEVDGDETGSAARRRARKLGWLINRDGSCVCPGCAKAGRRAPAL